SRRSRSSSVSGRGAGAPRSSAHCPSTPVSRLSTILGPSSPTDPNLSTKLSTAWDSHTLVIRTAVHIGPGLHFRPGPSPPGLSHHEQEDLAQHQGQTQHDAAGDDRPVRDRKSVV